VTAITHPDMVRIIGWHGLRPVPVDIDSATLAPRLDLVEAAITGRTRAILVAHLFGSRFDVGPVAEIARRWRSGAGRRDEPPRRFPSSG